MVILLFNAEQKINELTTALACAMRLADDDIGTEDDDKLTEQLFELQSTFRYVRKATLLAFQDWMSQHEFQIEREMLEANNVDFSILEGIEESDFRDTCVYQTFASIFQSVWDIEVTTTADNSR